MASTGATSTFATSNKLQATIKKHSTLSLFFESSDSEEELHILQPEIVETSTENFMHFLNKYATKDANFRALRLKAYREDATMQSFAKVVFDFGIDDKERFEILFNNEMNIKFLWQFIFLSFLDHDPFLMEVRHKQYVNDFVRINKTQLETGYINKQDGIKVYRLFKFFCLKDKVFNAFINKTKSMKAATEKEEKVQEEAKADTVEMDIVSPFKFPVYMDVEILMDNDKVSIVDFMSRFEKFKVNKISIDKAEDDICFNAQDHFEESNACNLLGLKFIEDEGTMDWKNANKSMRQHSQYR